MLREEFPQCIARFRRAFEHREEQVAVPIRQNEGHLFREHDLRHSFRRANANLDVACDLVDHDRLISANDAGKLIRP